MPSSTSFSDALFTYPQRIWAQGMSSVSSPVYLYQFTWAPPVEGSETYKAFHAGEIGYVFGNVDLFGAVPTEADYAFSDKISDIWVRFAKTGNPNGGDLPEWPAFTSENEAYMELGETIAAGSHPRTQQVDLIDRAYTERRASGGAAATGGGGS